MKVRWKGCYSSVRSMNGGGAQGSTPGIFGISISEQSCGQFLSTEDRYKFIDDLSILEIINLVNIGLISYNFQLHVSDEIRVGNQFLPPMNIRSQENLDEIALWTSQN